MPRPKNTVPSVDIHLMLPVDLVAEINLLLFSELQGRVPLGHMAKFYELAARERLARMKAEVVDGTG